MNDHKYAYCKHSEIKIKFSNVVTWCNKHDTWVFRDGVVKCDTCPIFEQDDKLKAEYDNNWRIPSPDRIEEISVFDGVKFYNQIVVTKGE